MRRPLTILFITIMITGIPGYRHFVQSPGRERIFLIEEKISLKSFPSAIDNLRIWIPVPSDSGSQVIGDFKLTGPLAATYITDKEYGNRIAYINAGREIELPCDITVSYKVKRKELGTLPGASGSAPDSPRELIRFLKPNRLVPVDGDIKDLAKEITRGNNNDLAGARAIYDYLIENYVYAKDDPNICGLGNTLVTLKHKKGMCSDWHSVFISLARSLGIPAKFEIGFPIPGDKKEGAITGYHCWAYFYAKGKGWVPVDASEAYKHPEKREYLFGHLDENRVAVGTGRDIVLEGAKNREPLNFFVYPYIEVNGRRLDDVLVTIAFHELRE